MNNTTPAKSLLKQSSSGTFMSESLKLKELFNNDDLDVEKYIEQQEIKNKANKETAQTLYSSAIS